MDGQTPEHRQGGRRARSRAPLPQIPTTDTVQNPYMTQQSGYAPAYSPQQQAVGRTQAQPQPQSAQYAAGGYQTAKGPPPPTPPEGFVPPPVRTHSRPSHQTDQSADSANYPAMAAANSDSTLNAVANGVRNRVIISQPPSRVRAPNVVLPSFHPVIDDQQQNLSEMEYGPSLGRKKSLVRPERRKSLRDRRPPVPGMGREAEIPEPAPSANNFGSMSTRSGRSDSSQYPLQGNRPIRSRSMLLGRRVRDSAPMPRASREEEEPQSWWRIMTLALTCCYPPFLLKACGKRTPEIRHAWREKVALCTIILVICGAVGFITFGFTQTICGTPSPRVKASSLTAIGATAIRGRAVSTFGYIHPSTASGRIDLYSWSLGRDIGFLYPIPANQSACTTLVKGWINWNCTVLGVWPQYSGQPPACHTTTKARDDLAKSLKDQGDVYYEWEDIVATAPVQRTGNVTVSPPLLVSYNGDVLDVFRLLAENPRILGDTVYKVVLGHLGGDITGALSGTPELKQAGKCLSEIFKVGVLEPKTVGCMISDVVLYVSLVFIVGVVVIKFALAVLFAWSMSWRLGDASASRRNPHPPTKGPLAETLVSVTQDSSDMPMGEVSNGAYRARKVQNGSGGIKVEILSGDAVADARMRSDSASVLTGVSAGSQQSTLVPNTMWKPKTLPDGWRSDLMYLMMMITCYSEGEDSMRATIDALSLTDYPDERKLILVVCDGIVKGAGNAKATCDIVADLMVPAPDLLNPGRFPDPPVEGAYVAIADGHKRENHAKVIGGYCKYALEQFGRRVPIISIVKVGNAEEQQQYKAGKLGKPGNRGKRDSQIVVMNFLQKVIFDDRLTDFEYDLFSKIWALGGVPPDTYEAMLCVDADTKVYPESIRHLVACMMKDPNVIGLCGETKIENKWGSWVTMIQVFEYHISHHLTKAFESMFGGVTCLPGCFSMYRIKAPKGPHGYYVPILANPDIVEQYSENVVDTLHKKNLLLLGEDRYLTTLMLKTFPKRKLLFVPQAKCKTIVPDEFSVLLSQRRRWINSTIHNLLELVLVKDLCGTFCISMQFVVFMELIGTVVLPAAISFTLYLVISSFFVVDKPIIPLVLLAAILGLPALLIVIASRDPKYVFWMLIYILSLPIWNFVLPTYAYWHFDDFSWGQTRQVSGEAKAQDHSAKEGEFEGSVVMHRWNEWERLTREKLATEMATDLRSWMGYQQRQMDSQYSSLPRGHFDSDVSSSDSRSRGPSQQRGFTVAPKRAF